MLKNYIKIAWKVLMRKKLYSLIMLTGITITIFISVIAISIFQQLKGPFPPESDFDKALLLNIINISEFNNGQRSNNFCDAPSYYFIKKYLKSMKTPKLVAVISDPFYSFDEDFYKKNKKTTFKIKYTDADFWKATNFTFIKGKPFNQSQFDNAEKIAVIDETMQHFYFSGKNPIGKIISIKNKSYRVVGVVKTVNVLRQVSFSNIWLPLTTEEIFNQKNAMGYLRAIVLAESKKDFDKIYKEFDSKMRAFDFSGFSTQDHIDAFLEPHQIYTEIRFKTGWNTQNETISFYIYLILFSTLLFYLSLPAINLLNINYNRIYERASEIGVRKSFGASSSYITMQFLIEQLFIILIGGALALILSYAAIQIFNRMNPIPNLQLSIGYKTFLTAIAICVLFSIITGVLPAIRYSKLSIINSLKSEQK